MGKKRIRNYTLLALGCIFTASAAFAGTGEVDVVGFYGQGFDFWSKVQEIQQNNLSPSDIANLLDSSFDHPQEGIASFGVRYQGPVQGDAARSFSLGDWFNRAYFGVGGDALAGGVATNRILPQVEAYQVYTGHIDFGLSNRVSAHEAGWEYKVGSTVAAGQETFVQGSAIDLQGNFADNESTLFYTGLDLDLGFKNYYNPDLKEYYRLTLQPTLFHSDFSSSAAQYKIDSDQLTIRWREENEWTLVLDPPVLPQVEIGVLAILGQQPTPITFLPRTWDFVHELNTWPSAGQLVGLGTRFRLADEAGHISLTLDGGFYGGYFGASAGLQIYGVHLTTGTYGLEQSSGYRIDESRIAFVLLGGQFAL
jgi:hypothetical protein